MPLRAHRTKRREHNNTHEYVATVRKLSSAFLKVQTDRALKCATPAIQPGAGA
jgi:hypothetical protein